MAIKSKTIPQGKLCCFWTKLREREKGFYQTKSGFVYVASFKKHNMPGWLVDTGMHTDVQYFCTIWEPHLQNYDKNIIIMNNAKWTRDEIHKSIKCELAKMCDSISLSLPQGNKLWDFSFLCLLVLWFSYCSMVSWISYFLCFTSFANLTGSYTEDDPFHHCAMLCEYSFNVLLPENCKIV